MTNSRVRVFFWICAAAGVLVAAYLYASRPRSDQARAAGDANASQDASLQVAAIPSAASGRIYFRHTGLDERFGRVAWTDTANPQDVHFIDGLKCEVVYVAATRGICLGSTRAMPTYYSARLFDAATLEISAIVPLAGIPSRARISRNGSLAAFTVFVSGHGYDTLGFSTQTLIVDAVTGAVLADLEEFEVRRDDKVIRSVDFNFWGVTFAPDENTFYATLSTNGEHFLVRGDLAARRVDVVHENVECPSLSPDARHVAYKKRLEVDSRVLWQLQVLDLETGREIMLSERRSVDDQLEWLDDRHVLYSVPSSSGAASPGTDVWIAPIEPAIQPQLFLRNAYSPAATG
jgi:hypothetical protein